MAGCLSNEKSAAMDAELVRAELVRRFKTGATRDTDRDKPDYAGYLSPLVIKRFGEYMLKHQTGPDGAPRASDNWKKGMPPAVYLSSLLRHVLDLWLHHEGHGDAAREGATEALCAIIFNAQGYLDGLLKGRPQ